ncbi:hypothetical protein CN444_15985 [Bacillus thuringiensis]|uniref:hypothetical protein n=1 Tax=Bacillus thuringiensis TaxID=1428 RepID=UPI000BF8B1FB|nr:hypothetical protein [Bacillus thuringiensis]PEW46596.1 hypothetical protein CN444_15985 [Bacillus thuringiensis]
MKYTLCIGDIVETYEGTIDEIVNFKKSLQLDENKQDVLDEFRVEQVIKDKYRQINELLRETYQIQLNRPYFTNSYTVEDISTNIEKFVQAGRKITGFSILSHGENEYGPNSSFIIRFTDNDI